MTDLQREIFGGSDESDLSEYEEEIARRSESPVAEESGPSDGDGEFKDEGRALPKFNKNRTSTRTDTAGPRRAPRRRKKEAVPALETALELPEMTLEEKRKYDLNKQIDAAAKMGRSTRPRKRKKGDEDLGDAATEEEVGRVKVSMEIAALEDQESNKNGKPALAKLRMLPEVTDLLQKQGLIQSIIDTNILEMVRTWLEPLSDKSLPALNIQRSIFDILSKMFIDTSALKESGLGKIVLFYTKKNKRVSSAIRAQADNLIAQWSRPILKRSASYRDRALPIAEVGNSNGGNSQRRGPKLASILAQSRTEEAGKPRRNAVRIPERNLGAYTVVPKSNVGAGPGGSQSQADTERRRIAQERLRKVQRKVEFNKQRTSRM